MTEVNNTYGSGGGDVWRFPCYVEEVVDGDTLIVVADRGMYDRSRFEIRLWGVDTAEVHNTDRDSEEYQLGMQQREFVKQWTDVDGEGRFPLTMLTYEEDGAFTRWLGDVAYNMNKLSEAILEKWPDAIYTG